MRPSFPPTHPIAPILEAPKGLIASILIWTLTMGFSQSLFYLLAELFHGGHALLDLISESAVVGLIGFPFACAISFMSIIGIPFVLLHLFGIYALLYSGMATFRVAFWIGVNQLIIAFIAAVALEGIASRYLVALGLGGALWYLIYLAIRKVREP